MVEEATEAEMIVRTERGLTIAGTRTTLYHVMDHVLENDPPEVIREWLNLTAQQVDVALRYIDSHRAEVEAEYREVLKRADESRRYWEERNRERLAQIAATPPRPGQEAIRAKLAAAQARRRQDA